MLRFNLMHHACFKTKRFREKVENKQKFKNLNSNLDIENKILELFFQSTSKIHVVFFS